MLRWCFVQAHADGWVRAVGATSLKVGQWYHVAGVYDGTAVMVYLNGVQDGLTGKPTGRTFANSDNLLEIGGNHQQLGGSLERCFKGRIDEIALQAITQMAFRELTTSEAQHQYFLLRLPLRPRLLLIRRLHLALLHRLQAATFSLLTTTLC